MSLEAIQVISEAEEAARHRKAEALQEAKRTVSLAEEQAAKALLDARAKAAEELKALQKTTDEKATADVRALADTTENRKAAMRAHGESRLDAAARLITERIVNG